MTEVNCIRIHKSKIMLIFHHVDTVNPFMIQRDRGSTEGVLGYKQVTCLKDNWVQGRQCYTTLDAWLPGLVRKQT